VENDVAGIICQALPTVYMVQRLTAEAKSPAFAARVYWSAAAG